MKTPSKCTCGATPEVFDLRDFGKDWVVHCPQCLEGTMTGESKEDAIDEWERIVA